MEDGRIAHYQITASSTWKDGTRAYFSRLNGDPVGGISNGVWTPSSHNTDQWIQVNLGIPRLITGIITQGRHGRDEWVTRYKVQYADDGVNWQYVVNGQQNEMVNLSILLFYRSFNLMSDYK